jgi:bifunctional UDP-N-acetylglucosamine pyrophosphorylase/glucosamine-1-phosphate N-acetyltransferase
LLHFQRAFAAVNHYGFGKSLVAKSDIMEKAIIILAAGKGERMRSRLPKVMHPLAGRPMLTHVCAVAGELAPARMVVVIGKDMDAARAAAPGAQFVVQDPPRGTGHAVACAREALAGFAGDVLILFGADPLITPQTLRRMLDARREAAVVVLGFRPDDPAHYGRLVIDEAGALERIVEFKDASAAERAIKWCNSGVMAVDGAVLFALIDALDDDNAGGEYYLTDIVAIARQRGLACRVVEAGADEVLGVNSREELAQVEAVQQNRLRRAAMAAGATLLDPGSVTFSYDTRLGRDVTVGPNVVFGPGVEVGDEVTIHPFCHLEGVRIAPRASVGPFARLRPGAEIGEEAKIGNFVEIKKAVVEQGAKVSHLSYIGDARIGAGANIGAGTITCNYDGFFKSFTDIGPGAFIGSNTALVAPVKIGAGAITGAGSTITRDVADDALATTRPQQAEKAGWARRFRARKAAQKAAAATGKK